MNLRKNPEKDIRRFSGLFFQIGLLSALLITVSAFEWNSPEEKPVVNEPDNLLGEDDIFPPITEIEEKKPPKPKKVNIVVTEPEKDEEVDISDLMEDWNEPEIEIDPEPLKQLDDEEVDVVYDYTDQRPEPKGGYEAFYQYVAKNINYTSQARRLNLEGKVFVQFVVDKEGNLTEVQVIRGLGAGLDEEAYQVVKNAPAWNPGRQGGRRVKVRMIIPIHFKLQ